MSAKMETMTIEDIKADAGGRALREHQMKGRALAPWEQLPKSRKRKWVIAAVHVIEAAKQAAIRIAEKPHA